MIAVFILAGIALLMIAFFCGYNLALRHESVAYQKLGYESSSLEPIFAMLDREYKYTADLAKPFYDEK